MGICGSEAGWAYFVSMVFAPSRGSLQLVRNYREHRFIICWLQGTALCGLGPLQVWLPGGRTSSNRSQNWLASSYLFCLKHETEPSGFPLTRIPGANSVTARTV